MDAQQPQKFVRHNEFSKEYQILPVNGVFGGPTPTGELLCNFYFERFKVPPVTELKISSDGNGVEEKGPYGDEVHVERIFEVGIALSAEMAVSIGEWMCARGKEMIASRGNTEDQEKV